MKHFKINVKRFKNVQKEKYYKFIKNIVVNDYVICYILNMIDLRLVAPEHKN